MNVKMSQIELGAVKAVLTIEERLVLNFLVFLIFFENFFFLPDFPDFFSK